MVTQFRGAARLSFVPVVVLAVSAMVSAQGPRAEAPAHRAQRLLTGPSLEVERGTPEGGIASAVVMEFRWLSPAEVPGTTVTYPPGTIGAGTNDLVLERVPPAGQPVFLGMFISGWGPFEDGFLVGAQGTLYSNSLDAAISVWRPFCPGDDDALCDPLTGTGIGSGCNLPPVDDDTCAPAYQDVTRSDWDDWGLFGCASATDDLVCFVNVFLGGLHPDPGYPLYMATFALFVDPSFDGAPATIEFDPSEGATGAVARTGESLVLKLVPATIALAPRGSCCYDIGLTSATPCASDVTQLECAALNTGPFPVVWREGEACPESGGPACPIASGACCNTVAGPLAPNGMCTNNVAYGDCQCADCTWFQNDTCDNVIAGGLCEADFVAIPTVSEWGLFIITLALLIAAKLYFPRRTVTVH